MTISLFTWYHSLCHFSVWILWATLVEYCAWVIKVRFRDSLANVSALLFPGILVSGKKETLEWWFLSMIWSFELQWFLRVMTVLRESVRIRIEDFRDYIINIRVWPVPGVIKMAGAGFFPIILARQEPQRYKTKYWSYRIKLYLKWKLLLSRIRIYNVFWSEHIFEIF